MTKKIIIYFLIKYFLMYQIDIKMYLIIIYLNNIQGLNNILFSKKSK